MAKRRHADSVGWRPGCLVMYANDEAQPMPAEQVYGQWCISVPYRSGTTLFSTSQVRAMITLADVTIAKACVRMPD